MERHLCFKGGLCWYFSTSITTALMYLGFAFYQLQEQFRSGRRQIRTCEHRSTRMTLLVSHSGFVWENIWLACNKWPFVVRKNTRAVQHCTSTPAAFSRFNPFCRSSNGLPARMICTMLRDRTLETSVVARQHLEACVYGCTAESGTSGSAEHIGCLSSQQSVCRPQWSPRSGQQGGFEPGDTARRWQSKASL